MSTHTFFRRADVPKAKAVADLLKRYPGAQVVGDVRTKRATPAEAKFASVRPGDRIYEATIKRAEDEEGEGADLDLTKDEPAEDSHPEPDADDKGGPSDDDADDKGSDKPPFGGKEKGEGGEAPKLDVKDRIADALDRIADALSGGGGLPGGPKPHDLGPGGPPPGPEGPGPDLPDIGAPPQGEELPPPVKPKAPGGPAFARVQTRVASAGTAVLVRRDVDDSVGTKEIIAEASEAFPGHKVAQVRRNGIAEIKGVPVDLPANKVALVTLVRK